MKRLIAERSVLYLGRMYAPGDALPASDGIMVAAWLRAKSAKWTGEAAEPQQSAQEDAAKTDGSPRIARDRTRARRARKTARRPKWWRDTWIPTNCPP